MLNSFLSLEKFIPCLRINTSPVFVIDSPRNAVETTGHRDTFPVDQVSGSVVATDTLQSPASPGGRVRGVHLSDWFVSGELVEETP